MEEPEEEIIVMEAITDAEKAFNNCLSKKYGIDPAYFHMEITVTRLSSDFVDPLRRITYENSIIGSGKE